MKKAHQLAALLFPALLGQVASGQWIINEILADPPAGVDVNGDGNASTTQDEFVELVNMTGAAVDIENWTINDGFGLRHTFVGSTIIGDGQAVVVFGGGMPVGTFGGAVVQVASDGALGLNNSGDTVSLFDAGLNLIASYDYGAEGGDNQSLTRDPDLTGATFVVHTTATGSGGAAFSPGTQIGGSPFGGDTVTVTFAANTISESDANPATTGTVTLSSPADGNLLVTLSSSDETEATVPATVTVLSGQTMASFDITVVDDAEVDGDQTTSISASATGFFSGSAELTVSDDEAPLPVVTMTADPTLISENGGSTTVTIEVDVPNAAGYTFTLSSDDTGELTVPGTVAIAANQTSATFTATGVDDAVADGTQNVTITAVDDFAVSLDATVLVRVSDDEAFTPPALSINELRIDNEGGDNDGVNVNEFVEIYGATPNYSLDRVWLIVLGDAGAGSRFGNIDRAYDLTGRTGNGNYFVIGGDTMVSPPADLPAGSNLFENGDSLTFLLVTDFTGSVGTDIDADDDGTLDETPWGSVIDAVSSLQSAEANDGEGIGYAAAFGGMDVTQPGPFPAAHLFRFPNGTGDFQIGPFEDVPATEFEPEIVVLDSPGAENTEGGINPPVGDGVEVVDFSMNRATGAGSLTVTGLGVQILVVESSTDLGQSDAWAPLANPAAEVDNPDGSVSFNFTDAEAVGEGKIFYRLNEAP